MKKIACILFSLALLALAAGTAARAADEAECYSVSGTVEFAKKGSSAWMPLIKGVLIVQGHTVRTGANSTAVLRWFDGNVVKIGPSSLFTIDSLSRSGAAETSKLDLAQGSVYAKSKKISAGQSSFEVKTPTAIAGVRGTEFLAAIAEGGKTTFAVADGQISVEAQSITVILDSNYMITVEPDQPPGEIFSISDEIKGRMQTDSADVAQASAAMPAPAPDKQETPKEEVKEETAVAAEKTKEEPPAEKPVAEQPVAKAAPPAAQPVQPQPPAQTAAEADAEADAVDFAVDVLLNDILHQDTINLIIDDVVTPALTCCTQ